MAHGVECFQHYTGLMLFIVYEYCIEQQA